VVQLNVPRPVIQKTKKTKHVLHSDLQEKLKKYREKRNFKPKDWINQKVKLFNEYLTESKLSAALVSVSGGIDSAVTLGLIKRASKEKGSPLKRVLAVAQPIYSSDWAYNRAKETAEALGAEFVSVDQTKQHETLSNLVDKAVGIQGGHFAKGQLRSYMRTPSAYYIAQLLTQNGTPCIVMGTGNMDEDGYLLYFCKAGDGVVDVQLIADLHKSEVFAVGKELGVPQSTLIAEPSADLWDGQTDEDELGFTYDFIELFTGDYLKLNEQHQKDYLKGVSEEGVKQFENWSVKAVAVHNRNKHKAAVKNINVL